MRPPGLPAGEQRVHEVRRLPGQRVVRTSDDRQLDLPSFRVRTIAVRRVRLQPRPSKLLAGSQHVAGSGRPARASGGTLRNHSERQRFP